MGRENYLLSLSLLLIGPAYFHLSILNCAGSFQFYSRFNTLSLEGIFGTGLFDNRIGRKFNKMSFLSEIDLLTARLWKLKNNLFLKLKLAE